MQYTCPRCGAIGAGTDNTIYVCHKCPDTIILLPSNNGKIITGNELYQSLCQTFLDDCIENRGYTAAEAIYFTNNQSADFIEQMIEEMWSNWSDNFPIRHNTDVRTSEEWSKTDAHKDVHIMDPDGWRDKNWPCDFKKDKITESEFIKRRSQSTCMFINKENK